MRAWLAYTFNNKVYSWFSSIKWESFIVNMNLGFSGGHVMFSNIKILHFAKLN